MTVKELIDYKKSLFSSLSRNLSEFEKNFILISGAILAFSITFINEIVQIECAQLIVFLFISWFFIIISISIMMLTFLKSSLASDKLWSLIDNFLIDNELFKEEIELANNKVVEIKSKINETFYKKKRSLKILRFLSVGTFILGIVFLSIFVSINLLNENKLTKKANSNKIEYNSINTIN